MKRFSAGADPGPGNDAAGVISAGSLCDRSLGRDGGLLHVFS